MITEIKPSKIIPCNYNKIETSNLKERASVTYVVTYIPAYYIPFAPCGLRNFLSRILCVGQKKMDEIISNDCSDHLPLYKTQSVLILKLQTICKSGSARCSGLICLCLTEVTRIWEPQPRVERRIPFVTSRLYFFDSVKDSVNFCGVPSSSLHQVPQC